ncbi:MAG TPA: hypothetical protein VI911_10450 [Patescibacteria group bacterium]|nr:hypothetical protein [Patescibacteria group bacterium]
MHKLRFESDDGTITCILTVNNLIPKEKVESAFRSLMLHLETSIGIYPNRLIFDSITKMRGEFYSNVLKFLVDENLSKGQKVPSHILKHLSSNRQSNWSFDEDD